MLEIQFSDITKGLVGSLIPIVFLSQYPNKDTDYPENIPQIIVIITLVNLIMMPIFRHFKIRSYFLIGLIIGIVISSLDRFYLKFPEKVKVDGNLYQVMSILIWSIFYGTIGKKMDKRYYTKIFLHHKN